MNDSGLAAPFETTMPASLRKAILWGNGQFLTEAVELFLRTEPTLEIIKLLSDSNADHLIRWVKQTKPNIVILCQETDSIDTALLFRLFQSHSEIKVVVLSMESNLMQIYSKQDCFMRTVSDLLSVVEMEHCD